MESTIEQKKISSIEKQDDENKETVAEHESSQSALNNDKSTLKEKRKYIKKSNRWDLIKKIGKGDVESKDSKKKHNEKKQPKSTKKKKEEVQKHSDSESEESSETDSSEASSSSSSEASEVPVRRHRARSSNAARTQHTSKHRAVGTIKFL